MTIRAFDSKTFGSFNHDESRFTFYHNSDRTLTDRDRPSFGSGKEAAISLFAKFEDRLTSPDASVRANEWNSLRRIVAEGIVTNKKASYTYKNAEEQRRKRQSIGNGAFSDEQINALVDWQLARHAAVENAVKNGFRKNAVENALTRLENHELNAVSGVKDAPSQATASSLATFLEHDPSTIGVQKAIQELYISTAAVSDAATISPEIIDAQFDDNRIIRADVADGKFEFESDEEMTDLTPTGLLDRERFADVFDADLLTPEQRVDSVKAMLAGTRADADIYATVANPAFVTAAAARSDLLTVFKDHGIVAPELFSVINAFDRRAFGLPVALTPELTAIVENIEKTSEYQGYRTAIAGYVTSISSKENPSQIRLQEQAENLRRSIQELPGVKPIDGLSAIDHADVFYGVHMRAVGVNADLLPASFVPDHDLSADTMKVVNDFVSTPEYDRYKDAVYTRIDDITTRKHERSEVSASVAHSTFFADLNNAEKDPLSRVDIVARTREEAEIIKRVVTFAAIHGQGLPSPSEAAVAFNAIRKDLSKNRVNRQPSLLLRQTPRTITRQRTISEIAVHAKQQAAYYAALAANPGAAIAPPVFTQTGEAKLHPYWASYYAGHNIPGGEFDRNGAPVPQQKDENGKWISKSLPILATEKVEERALFGPESHSFRFPITAFVGTPFYKNTTAIEDAINNIASGNKKPEAIMVGDQKQFPDPKTSILVAFDPAANDPKSASRSTAATLAAAEKAGMKRVDVYVSAVKAKFTDIGIKFGKSDTITQINKQNIKENFLTFTTENGVNIFDKEKGGQSILRGAQVNDVKKTAPKAGTIIVLHPGGNLAINENEDRDPTLDRDRRDLLQSALHILASDATFFGVNSKDVFTGKCLQNFAETHKNIKVLDDAGKPVALEDALKDAKAAAPRRRDARETQSLYQLKSTIGAESISSTAGRLFLSQLVGQKEGVRIANRFNDLPNGAVTPTKLRDIAHEDLPQFARNKKNGTATPEQLNSIAIAKAAGGALLNELRNDRRFIGALISSNKIVSTTMPVLTDYKGIKSENPDYRNRFHAIDTTSALTATAGRPISLSISPDLDIDAHNQLTAPKAAILGTLSPNQSQPSQEVIDWIDKAAASAAKSGVAISTTADGIGAHVILAAQKHDARIMVVGGAHTPEMPTDEATKALKEMIASGKAAYATTNFGIDHTEIKELNKVTKDNIKAIEKETDERRAIIAEEVKTLSKIGLNKDTMAAKVKDGTASQSDLDRVIALSDQQSKTVAELKKQHNKWIAEDQKMISGLRHETEMLVAKSGETHNPVKERMNHLELATSTTNSILVVTAPANDPVVLVAGRAATNPLIAENGEKVQKVAALYLPGRENAGARELSTNNGHVAFQCGRSGSLQPGAAVLFTDVTGLADNLKYRPFGDAPMPTREMKPREENTIVTNPTWVSHGWTVAPGVRITNEKPLDAFVANSVKAATFKKTSSALTAADIAFISGARRNPGAAEMKETDGITFPDRKKSNYTHDMHAGYMDADMATTKHHEQSRKTIAATIGI